MSERPHSAIFVSRPTLPALDDLHHLLKRVWEAQHVTNFGPLESKFASGLRDSLNLRDVLLFANGHLAIESMLRTLNSELRTGGEVITTPFTFASTVHAIVNAGFEPVFVDVDPSGFGPCPAQVERACSPDTRAVLGVHVYGVACKVDLLKVICDRKGVSLFFDAAHAFGVNYNGRSLISYGDASVVSLHATKIMNSIEGGLLSINSGSFNVDAARMFRNFGLDGDDVKAGGSNAKMSEMHAAVGLLNLADFEQTLERRLEIASKYDEAFVGNKSFQPLRPSSPNASYYAIQFPGSPAEAAESRAQAIESAQSVGVFSRPYFSPGLDQTSAFSKYAKGKVFKRANELSSSVLCLPIYPTMTLAEQGRVIDAFL